MGGADSEVSAGTKTIAIESAYFNPASVRRTSKRLGLSTEASYRFERGADPEAASAALARACELLAQIGAGVVRAGWIDARPAVRVPRTLLLRHGRVHRVPDGPVLVDSYHCSRYNTQTRRLTAEMFAAVVAKARALADE